MFITVEINGSAQPEHHYINWAPIECQIRLNEGDGEDVAVTLKNQDPNGPGGQVVFLVSHDADETDVIDLTLPADGSPITFFIAGKFGHPSIGRQDATISVVGADESELAQVPLMVRVRKNANTLDPIERDAYLYALAHLNANPSNSIFHDLYMYHHNDQTNALFHNEDSFYPWHRAYILGLERALQEIDPTVSLPYWRFDENAANVFTPSFLGETQVSNFPQRVVFDPANPLANWSNFDGTNIIQGVMRGARFDPITQNPSTWNPGETFPQSQALSYSDTFRTSGGQKEGGIAFMEARYHNWAHNSFRGDLPDSRTAPRDPLFFFLHCNVDRFWALWQLTYQRFKKDEVETYYYQETYDGPPPRTMITNNLKDTLWPWNNQTSANHPDYPDFAQPLGYRPSPLPAITAPGKTPQLGEVMDYLGTLNSSSHMGFSYDDVPFVSES